METNGKERNEMDLISKSNLAELRVLDELAEEMTMLLMNNWLKHIISAMLCDAMLCSDMIYIYIT
jgi:hypothetical protein